MKESSRIARVREKASGTCPDAIFVRRVDAEQRINALRAEAGWSPPLPLVGDFHVLNRELPVQDVVDAVSEQLTYIVGTPSQTVPAILAAQPVEGLEANIGYLLWLEPEQCNTSFPQRILYQLLETAVVVILLAECTGEGGYRLHYQVADVPTTEAWNRTLMLRIDRREQRLTIALPIPETAFWQ